MSQTHSYDFKKEVRIYVMIFAALAVLTILTVAVSYLKISLALAITIALCIATFKASLVAAYFMHLISEKALVYVILTFTAVFLIGMIFWIILGYHDVQQGIRYVS